MVSVGLQERGNISSYRVSMAVLSQLELPSAAGPCLLRR